jgi:hypothetical protein
MRQMERPGCGIAARDRSRIPEDSCPGRVPDFRAKPYTERLRYPSSCDSEPSFFQPGEIRKGGVKIRNLQQPPKLLEGPPGASGESCQRGELRCRVLPWYKPAHYYELACV